MSQGWCTIDIPALESFITDLRDAAEEVETNADRIQVELDRVDAHASGPSRMRQIVGEIRGWIPDLRRRLVLARRIVASESGQSCVVEVRIDEDLISQLSVAEAGAEGRRLAGQVADGDITAELLAEIEELSVDPYFAAAFAAPLDPDQTLAVLTDPDVLLGDTQVPLASVVADVLSTASVDGSVPDLADRWVETLAGVDPEDVLTQGAAGMLFGELAARTTGSGLPAEVEQKLQRMADELTGVRGELQAEAQGPMRRVINEQWNHHTGFARGAWDNTLGMPVNAWRDIVSEGPIDFYRTRYGGFFETIQTLDGWKQIGKDVVQWDAFAEGDYGYALGSFAPGIVAGLASGGGSTVAQTAARLSRARTVAAGTTTSAVRNRLSRIFSPLGRHGHGRGLGVYLPSRDAVGGIGLGGFGLAGLQGRAREAITRFRHRKGAQWSGEGGLHLDAYANAVADDFIRRARTAEPAVTDEMVGLADRHGGHMEGMSHRLKSEDSLKRKLATELLNDDELSATEVMSSVKDSVRYTMRFADQEYVGSVQAIVHQVRSQGYEQVSFKNSWGGSGYQGVNTAWRHPGNGQTFELQFHTADSFQAKMETHGLYEEARLPNTSPERTKELQRIQNERFDRVKIPTGAPDVAP